MHGWATGWGALKPGSSLRPKTLQVTALFDFCKSLKESLFQVSFGVGERVGVKHMLYDDLKPSNPFSMVRDIRQLLSKTEKAFSDIFFSHRIL